MPWAFCKKITEDYIENNIRESHKELLAGQKFWLPYIPAVALLESLVLLDGMGYETHIQTNPNSFSSLRSELENWVEIWLSSVVQKLEGGWVNVKCDVVWSLRDGIGTLIRKMGGQQVFCFNFLLPKFNFCTWNGLNLKENVLYIRLDGIPFPSKIYPYVNVEDGAHLRWCCIGFISILGHFLNKS